MINKSGFKQKSAGLPVSNEVLSTFYTETAKLLAEYYKKGRDWDKIMAIENKSQWPLLQLLGNPRLPIYEGAEKKDVGEFVSTIKDEIYIRQNMTSSNMKDSLRYLKFLTTRRIEFFNQILEVTEKDIQEFKSESSWAKWLIIGGALVIMGIVRKKISESKGDEEKNETK